MMNVVYRRLLAPLVLLALGVFGMPLWALSYSDDQFGAVGNFEYVYGITKKAVSSGTTFKVDLSFSSDAYTIPDEFIITDFKGATYSSGLRGGTWSFNQTYPMLFG